MSSMSVPISLRKRSRSAHISFSVLAWVFVMMTTLSRATVLSASFACGCVPYWSARSQIVTPWSTPARSRSTTPSRPRPRVWFEDLPTPFVPVPWNEAGHLDAGLPEGHDVLRGLLLRRGVEVVREGVGRRARPLRRRPNRCAGTRDASCLTSWGRGPFLDSTVPAGGNTSRPRRRAARKTARPVQLPQAAIHAPDARRLRQVGHDARAGRVLDEPQQRGEDARRARRRR